MTTLIRARVPKKLKENADKVCGDLGINLSAAVRLFLAQLVRDRAMPFRPDASEDDGMIPVAYRARVLDSFYDEDDANSEAR